jgi:hypothetical protein
LRSARRTPLRRRSPRTADIATSAAAKRTERTPFEHHSLIDQRDERKPNVVRLRIGEAGLARTAIGLLDARGQLLVQHLRHANLLDARMTQWCERVQCGRGDLGDPVH